MKEIPLHGKYGEGKVTLVDDEDFEELNKFRWYLDTNGYVHREIRIVLARSLLGNPVGFKVDHQDGDPLNNQRSNLRRATNRQNTLNAKKMKGTSSIYKGVSFKWEYDNDHIPRSTRWAAYVRTNGKTLNLGYFRTERQAAMAYDLWAHFLYGEFARPNFPNALHG